MAEYNFATCSNCSNTQVMNGPYCANKGCGGTLLFNDEASKKLNKTFTDRAAATIPMKGTGSGDGKTPGDTRSAAGRGRGGHNNRGAALRDGSHQRKQSVGQSSRKDAGPNKRSRMASSGHAKERLAKRSKIVDDLAALDLKGPEFRTGHHVGDDNSGWCLSEHVRGHTERDFDVCGTLMDKRKSIFPLKPVDLRWGTSAYAQAKVKPMLPVIPRTLHEVMDVLQERVFWLTRYEEHLMYRDQLLKQANILVQKLAPPDAAEEHRKMISRYCVIDDRMINEIKQYLYWVRRVHVLRETRTLMAKESGVGTEDQEISAADALNHLLTMDSPPGMSTAVWKSAMSVLHTVIARYQHKRRFLNLDLLRLMEHESFLGSSKVLQLSYTALPKLLVIIPPDRAGWEAKGLALLTNPNCVKLTAELAEAYELEHPLVEDQDADESVGSSVEEDPADGGDAA